MEKKEFIELMKKDLDEFSEEMEKYDDLPDDMHFEDWYDQFIAHMSLG